MTDAAIVPDSREPVPFLHLWANALSQAIGEIGGVPVGCALLSDAPPEAGPVSPADLCVVGGCSGALRGEMSLRLLPATTARLAQILMNEPAAPAEITPEHRDAALELLRQVSGLAATEIRATRGEVQLRLEAAAAPPSWPASFTAWFRVGEETSPVFLEVRISAALVASLRAERAEQPVANAAAAAGPSTAVASGPHDEKVNLDLLMDVELDVTIRFGGRQMLLRELLDLSPGSVVALDRHVQEPVDMLLDGRVVARGEVVVAAGNYALRVIEIGADG